MLLESLDDTLKVDGKSYAKGERFEMTNIGAAMGAVEAGLAKAVERDLVNVTDRNADRTTVREAAKIAAAESEPGTIVGDPVRGKKK